MKRVLCLFFAAALACFAFPTAFAAEESVDVYLNGELLPLDPPAVLVGDTAMVPVRQIADRYQTPIEWNEEDKSVTVTSSGFPWRFQLGNQFISYTNEPGAQLWNIGAAPVLIGGTFYAPARAVFNIISTNINAIDVGWDEEKGAVTVRDYEFDKLGIAPMLTQGRSRTCLKGYLDGVYGEELYLLSNYFGDGLLVFVQDGKPQLHHMSNEGVSKRELMEGEFQEFSAFIHDNAIDSLPDLFSPVNDGNLYQYLHCSPDGISGIYMNNPGYDGTTSLYTELVQRFQTLLDAVPMTATD